MDAGSKPSPLYLFYGEESFLIQNRVKNIIARRLSPDEQEFNLVMLENDPPVPELLQLVESAPFFGEHKVVVVKNTKLFQAPRRKSSDGEDGSSDSGPGAESGEDAKDSGDLRLQVLFAHMPPYATLLFTAAKADKRKKITKVLAEYGQIQELNPFRPMEEREVRQWLEEQAVGLGKRLQRGAVDHLMAVVGTMQQIPRSFLAGELEKAALFSGTDPVINQAAMEAVMSTVPEVSAFSLTEALAAGQVGPALARLEELLVNREPPLKIIGLLAFKIRQWWLVRQMLDRQGTETEIFDALGAQGGRMGMARRIIMQSRSFRAATLKNALLTLASANAAIRSGGDPQVYLERVIIELCNAK